VWVAVGFTAGLRGHDTPLVCWGVAYVLRVLAIASSAAACTVQPGAGTSATSANTVGTATLDPVTGDDDGDTATASSTATAGTADTTAGDKLDVSTMPGTGCQYVDLLFVIDNSDSMETYQQALADQFPAFVDAMFEELPAGIGVHVGITTTEFDAGCEAAETTGNCQSTASLEDVQAHYLPPTEMNDGGNGSQGRLFQWSGQYFFDATTDDDPAELSTWFSGAATAAGENGCSFEMPVAAAGWATHLANAVTNDGFIRDEGGLLVVFFLTDEPDKSPESTATYETMLLDAKAECGGADCVFVSGLVPPCVSEINQKLWQFMSLWSDADPQWGDIVDTAQYDDVVGEALAGAVAEACANIPVG
jgi:hypothetical protein